MNAFLINPAADGGPSDSPQDSAATRTTDSTKWPSEAITGVLAVVLMVAIPSVAYLKRRFLPRASVRWFRYLWRVPNYEQGMWNSALTATAVILWVAIHLSSTGVASWRHNGLRSDPCLMYAVLDSHDALPLWAVAPLSSYESPYVASEQDTSDWLELSALRSGNGDADSEL